MKNPLKMISPTGFTVISVISGGLSIISTIFATRKTLKEFDEKKPETFGAKAKIVVKNYAIPASLYGLSAGTSIASNAKNLSNQAVILGEALAAHKTVSEYKEAIKEIVSDDELKMIEEAKAKKTIENSGIKGDLRYLPQLGDEPLCWCIEASTRQRFRFPYMRASQIAQKMILLLKRNDTVRASEYYDIINEVADMHCIDNTNISDDIGWNSEDCRNETTGEIEFNVLLLADKALDGSPVLLIDTEIPPYESFDADS